MDPNEKPESVPDERVVELLHHVEASTQLVLDQTMQLLDEYRKALSASRAHIASLIADAQRASDESSMRELTKLSAIPHATFGVEISGLLTVHRLLLSLTPDQIGRLCDFLNADQIARLRSVFKSCARGWGEAS